MRNEPVLIAYTVTGRPGQKLTWRRIGAAFPADRGLTVLRRRIVLVEPKVANVCTATFFPATIPVQLATRPALRGERRVWEALRAAKLSARTRLFYNRSPKGCRRRADMLIIDPERGIIAIEVKSGRVSYRKGLRQQLAGGQRWHKRIEPWGQAQRALAEAFAALGLNPIAIPQAFMLALPAMRRDALPFASAPHMLTAEDLAPAALARKLDALLPRLDPATRAALAPAFENIAAALTRPADADASSAQRH
jgi:hypothetical protein